MFRNFTFALIFLLASCATTSTEKIADIQTAPLLTVTPKTKLNDPKRIKRNDLIFVIEVVPTHLAQATETQNIEISAGGFVDVKQGDVYFPVVTPDNDKLFCSFDNAYRNSFRTLIKQTCLRDENNDGRLNSFFVRSGADSQDVPGFLYYDAEISPLTAIVQTSGPYYSLVDATPDQSYQIAFCHKIIKRRKGERIAVLEMLTKRPNERKWQPFPTRTAIEVSFDPDTNIAVFETPLLTAEFTQPDNNSYTATITNTEGKGSLGFKRSLNDANKNGYRPAYQISGK